MSDIDELVEYIIGPWNQAVKAFQGAYPVGRPFSQYVRDDIYGPLQADPFGLFELADTTAQMALLIIGLTPQAVLNVRDLVTEEAAGCLAHLVEVEANRSPGCSASCSPCPASCFKGTGRRSGRYAIDTEFD